MEKEPNLKIFSIMRGFIYLPLPLLSPRVWNLNRAGEVNCQNFLLNELKFSTNKQVCQKA
jgi:hypothetical protein